MTLSKAELWKLDAHGKEILRFPVQFNPESLKVSFANQIVPPANSATDLNQGTSSTQYVGQGTTKLSVQLWFDVTAELPKGLATDSKQQGDVRELTRRVVDLITPQPSQKDKKRMVPPAVRFLWGSFQFDGIMESLEQSLEFFSPEGIPLRASFTLSLTQQRIDYGFPAPSEQSALGAAAANLPSGAAPGTSALTPAPAGSTLQGLAAAQGRAGDWQAIAAANGIENPRLLAPGQLIDMNVSAPRDGISTPRANISGFSFSTEP
jgi:hypothetical protein